MHRFVSCSLASLAALVFVGCGSAPDSSIFSSDEDANGGNDSSVAFDSATPTDGNPTTDSSHVDAPPPDAPVDHAPPPPPVGDTCATAIAITPTTTPQTATGDSSAGANDDSTYTCGAGNGNDIFFTVAHPGGDLWVDTHGTAYATILALRTACATASSEVACSEKTSSAPDSSRIIYRNLAAGTYTLVLDGSAAGGGAYALTYAAPGFPVQSTCETPEMLVSDLGTGDAVHPMGADVWESTDTPTMTSNVELRPGPTGSDTCMSATGRAVFGQGPDQIYRLRLAEDRKLKITPFAVDPGAFSSAPPATFDLLTYLRDATGDPHGGDPLANCQDSTSSTSDTCVDYGTEQSVPKGDWFLVFDSIGGSVGKYHMHVEIR